MPDAVLVIDMVRGFLEESGPLYIGASARRIIPNLRLLLDEETKKGATIFFISDCHAPGDRKLETFPPYCIQGTPEAEIVPELAGFRGEAVEKTRFSAFYGTGLEEKLAALKPGKLIVSGVSTDISVMHTVADARSRGYEVEVPLDGVASPDPKAHYASLSHMEKVLGARLTRIRRVEVKEPDFRLAPEVLSGETADVYFPRTLEVLKKENINPIVTGEIFCSRAGIICGVSEVKALLKRVLPGDTEVWALEEGSPIAAREVCLRLKGPYQSYGLYETAVIGTLAHATAWATAARECVEAAAGLPVISFGARHVHPNVAAVMDYAAVVGGCAGCSTVLGAKYLGINPSGTMPHALILIMGDTVRAALAFDRDIAPEVPRVALVDTFKDEAEESLRVAAALGDKLAMVRLDTPAERGRVTIGLIKEVRARLDLAGYKHVGIFVSGGITPERIREFLEGGAPVVGFGVGSYISAASPNDFKLDIHEIDGRPVAKRGRIPGLTPNPRLKRII